MKTHFPDVDALILCGGAGQRMGGQDKGLLPWQGHSAAEGLRDFARSQGVAQVWLSANRHLPQYQRMGFSGVLPDLRPPYLGPLAGIEAGLIASTAPWLLVLPCDSLDLPLHLLPALYQTAQAQARPWVWAEDPQGVQRCISLLQRSLLPAIQNALALGQRSLYRLQEQSAGMGLLFPQHVFDNRNQTPDWLAPLMSNAAAMPHPSTPITPCLMTSKP
jgi:molybdopterin-guanine dinucleotide biosynthesis protein A